jgi:outer membrane receptor protein involved in Fe transport
VTKPVGAAVELTGNVYVRNSDIDTLNGDDSDFEECDNAPGFICEEEDGEEEIVLDENDEPILAEGELEGATVNRTSTDQSSVGFGFQASSSADLNGHDNQLVAGVVYDQSEVEFEASTELGALDETRLAVPGGAFVGEGFTELESDTSNLGLFVSNVFSLTDNVALTLSARYNRTDVTLEDQEGDELNGEHEFDRFNPAVGITYAITPALTLYAGYSEANRAPSPVELTCADEDDPCRLPNAFLADPPLEQVVAKTFEAGVRGTWDDGRWHAGLFHTTNDDDILFISAGALTNEGFFDNVGRTRREGLELNFDGTGGERLTWFADYTYLDATFRTSFAVPSPNNPESVDGEIAVEVGDRLPLVPEHLLKTGIRVTAGESFTFGADVYASSSQFFRGDEGNAAEEIDGYALLNLRGEYRASESLRFLLAIDNVLDEEYETFGVFGEAEDVLGDDFDDPEFLGPGAPRAFWVGVQLAFD